MKRDTRQAIIDAGGDLVHRQGFHRTGLKEILDAAGVPKGSFYFYFRSKEDFGLALIEHCAQGFAALADQYLDAPLDGPLARLAGFFVMLRERLAARGYERGCPLGNLAQEISDLSPPMRQAVSHAMRGMAGRLARVLAQSRDAGEIPADLDPDATAAFMLEAWEGALLRMKAEKSGEPLRRFEDFVLHRLLR